MEIELKNVPDYFVPCFNTLLQVKEFNDTTALVYGKIWQYSQMRDKHCWASKERIAEELGISPDTVYRHIKKLLKKDNRGEGYIAHEGFKPDKRTSIYYPTERLSREFALQKLFPESAKSDAYTSENDPKTTVKSETNRIINRKTNNKHNSPYGELCAETLVSATNKIDSSFSEIKANGRNGNEQSEKINTSKEKEICLYTLGLLFPETEFTTAQKQKAYSLWNEYGREKFEAMINWVAKKQVKNDEVWSVTKVLGVMGKYLPNWKIYDSVEEFLPSASEILMLGD